MPMELRKIAFAKEELKSAAYGYCLHMGKSMPDAVVSDLIVQTAPDLVARLCFDVNHPADTPHVELQRGEIAAALIRYCQRLGVPIPRNARKGIQPEGDGVAMIINLNYRTAEERAA